MKVLVIEDEPQAAERLTTLIGQVVPEANVLASIDSVRKAVEWLRSHPMPDMVFMDIQLADGLSFSIFDQVQVSAPVIFTTAYDAYALKAFKVNSIDYILKPVDRDDLSRALKKLSTLARGHTEMKVMLENIGSAIDMMVRRYKNRFVIKVGEHLRTISVDSILFFYSQNKATFCVTDDNRNHVLDFTLEQIEEMVDPGRFFRINRKYMVSSDAIRDIITYTNSRLKLVIRGSNDTDVIVARERAQDFRNWLDQ